MINLYIVFRCWSSVGMDGEHKFGPGQDINLGYGCDEVKVDFNIQN